MKRSSHRPQQVAETIRQVIADALVREARDPRLGRVTITAVRVTPDLALATLRVTVPEADRERTLEGLESATGFLRSRIAKALATRVLPEIRFELDRGAEHVARIDELLRSIHEEEGA